MAASPGLVRRFYGFPADYRLVSGLFVRLLGLIYFVAFVSLWVQLSGLVGSHGILPAADFLQSIRVGSGPERYWLLPTLFWLNAGDAALNLVCGGGAVLALLLMAGLAPGLILFLLWLFYLSLTVAGQDFLAFQWDNLLLEAGFLAIFLTPWQLRSRLSRQPRPSLTVLWLLRWLLFRLMFGSGVVKLLSGDPTWRNLTALTYHYETQPLPAWTSWYAHQLPLWFHQLSAAAMFGIELVVPFFIFGPRRLRLTAAGLLVALQLLIMITGNFAFFNWLAILLCLLLLDDPFLRRLLSSAPLNDLGRGLLSRLWPGRRPAETGPAPTGLSARPERDIPPPLSDTPSRPPAAPGYQWFLTGLLAVVVLLVSGLELVGLFKPLPAPVGRVLRWVAPFRTINTYGLFAVMTTSRPELIIEGSNDAETWLAYEFKWKPGDVQRRPRFVAPYQPRLDWQMWFAALGDVQNRWFVNFLLRLRQGSPVVLALLDHNPFPDAPPRYLRVAVYTYHFTTLAGSDRAWWQRELIGVYTPRFSEGP